MGRIVFGMIATLLLIGMLTFAFNINPVKAGMDGFTPQVTVSPEHPSTEDNVSVTVIFTFYTSPPYVEEFGSLTHVSNTFSTNTTIYVPYPGEIVTDHVSTRVTVYSLGKLSEGSYQFQVYVTQMHYNSTCYLAASAFFNVTLAVNPVGGYSFATEGYSTVEPPTFYLALIAILAVSITAIKRKTSRKTK